MVNRLLRGASAGVMMGLSTVATDRNDIPAEVADGQREPLRTELSTPHHNAAEVAALAARGASGGMSLTDLRAANATAEGTTSHRADITPPDPTPVRSLTGSLLLEQPALAASWLKPHTAPAQRDLARENPAAESAIGRATQEIQSFLGVPADRVWGAGQTQPKFEGWIASHHPEAASASQEDKLRLLLPALESWRGEHPVQSPLRVALADPQLRSLMKEIHPRAMPRLSAEQGALLRDANISIQQHLARLGLYSGPVDGLWYTGQSAATRAWAKQRGVQSDGRSLTTDAASLLLSELTAPSSGAVTIRPQLHSDLGRGLKEHGSAVLLFLQPRKKSDYLALRHANPAAWAATSKAVSEVQEFLGVPVDGIWGAGQTQPAFAKWLASAHPEATSAPRRVQVGLLVDAIEAWRSTNPSALALEVALQDRQARPMLRELSRGDRPKKGRLARTIETANQEIQEHLRKKGYYQGKTDGWWYKGQSEALKAWAEDRDLMVDGRALTPQVAEKLVAELSADKSAEEARRAITELAAAIPGSVLSDALRDAKTILLAPNRYEALRTGYAAVAQRMADVVLPTATEATKAHWAFVERQFQEVLSNADAQTDEGRARIDAASSQLLGLVLDGTDVAVTRKKGELERLIAPDVERLTGQLRAEARAELVPSGGDDQLDPETMMTSIEPFFEQEARRQVLARPRPEIAERVRTLVKDIAVLGQQASDIRTIQAQAALPQPSIFEHDLRNLVMEAWDKSDETRQLIAEFVRGAAKEPGSSTPRTDATSTAGYLASVLPQILDKAGMADRPDGQRVLDTLSAAASRGNAGPVALAAASALSAATEELLRRDFQQQVLDLSDILQRENGALRAQLEREVFDFQSIRDPHERGVAVEVFMLELPQRIAEGAPGVTKSEAYERLTRLIERAETAGGLSKLADGGYAAFQGRYVAKLVDRLDASTQSKIKALATQVDALVDPADKRAARARMLTEDLPRILAEAGIDRMPTEVQGAWRAIQARTKMAQARGELSEYAETLYQSFADLTGRSRVSVQSLDDLADRSEMIGRWIAANADVVITPEGLIAMVEEALGRKDPQIRRDAASIAPRLGAALIEQGITDPAAQRAFIQDIAKGSNGFSFLSYELGQISAPFESGRRGPGAISTGRGDPGGTSYGLYQFTRANVERVFLANPLTKAWLAENGYKNAFRGLRAGTPAFNAVWKKIAREDPKGFGSIQHDVIWATHGERLFDRLKAVGVDPLEHSLAFQELAWSISVQHGPEAGWVTRVAAAHAPKKYTKPSDDAALIDALMRERSAVRADGRLKHFSRIPANSKWIPSLKSRFRNERNALHKLLEKQEAMESAIGIKSAPRIPGQKPPGLVAERPAASATLAAAFDSAPAWRAMAGGFETRGRRGRPA